MKHLDSGLDIQALRERLAARTPRRLREGPVRRAAVLVPIAGTGEDLRLILFQRTHSVLEHKGEICFPGGAVEPDDAGVVEAALREAHEELGLKREDIEVMGILDDVYTVASSYVITPVVGHLAGMPELKPDGAEVDKPIIVRLRDLTKPGAEGTEWLEWAGVSRMRYYYDVEGGHIWGATARILHGLLEMWAADPAPASKGAAR